MQSRQIAHIIIEADTPLKVGSNNSDFLQDSPIQKDFNGLPMILGTSIAGVLRKDFDETKVNDVFGKENGSKVIISNALLLDDTQRVNEELLPKKTRFLKLFDILPIREHVGITDKGVANNGAKFDEEVLYKGTRFKFSMEMLDDEESFEEILELLQSNTFRLGGGSTKGFGKVKVVSISTDTFDIESYENYSSSLNHRLSQSFDLKEIESKNYTKYILNLTPDDFFMFGSGFGDGDADSTQVYEDVIDYDERSLKKKKILIPASSIKGAIAHRTLFHYNSLKENTIEANNGVKLLETIFGEAKNTKEDKGFRGKVIFSDVYLEDKKQTKVFDHVSIDRFTGGAIDGVLFQEKTIAQDDTFDIEILLHKDVKDKELKAFEKALKDITTGMLSLGAMTSKGHGVFSGSVTRNGMPL